MNLKTIQAKQCMITNYSDDNNIKYKQYIRPIKLNRLIQKMHRNNGSINPEIVSNKVSPTHHHNHAHDNPRREEYYQQQYDQYDEQSGDERDGSRVEPIWREKQKRRKQRKQIFGEHYNYNYRKPNQQKMYRVQQNRNTQIQRANRILLQKIQSIFKRSMGKKKTRQMTVAIASQANSQAPTNVKTQNAEIIHRSSNQIRNKRNLIQEQEIFEQKKQKRTNRNSTVEKLGNLNKDLELAKRELYRQEKMSKNFRAGELSKQVSLNKNLIKLQEIDSIGHKKRRFQTEMNQPTQKKKNKTINKLEAANTYERQRDIPTVQNESIQKHITSRNNISPSPYNISPILEQKPPKIILFRQKNIKIGHKVFDIEAYVEGNTYLISAMSLNQNKQQFHQLITMPYPNYQELYKAKLTQNHENIIHYLQIQKKNGLLQVRGFERKYMDIFEQGQVQVNADNKSTDNHKSRMEQRKNFIVHYNNNPDDTFDRITLINSDNNTNSIPPSINQLQSQQKQMNKSRYKKSSNRQSRVSVRKQNNQRNKQIQATDKLKESRVQTKRKVNSNNENFIDKQQSKQIKSQTVPIQKQKQKIIKKQICTMTDNILPQSEQNYQDNNNKDVVGNNMSMNSSSLFNNSKVMKKSPTLSSNLINIHIQPVTSVNNAENKEQNKGTKMQQNESSFFSDITMSNKNKNKLQKQEQQLLLDHAYPKEKKKNKPIQNQYQDIQDIISDSGLK